jgi:hypothetical protein
MIRRSLAHRAVLGALLLATTAASGATRALFVGIDTYQFSAPGTPGADPKFISLQGSVNDVAMVKMALSTNFPGLAGLDPGGLKPTPMCNTGNAVSITLTNACATRDAIFAAFAKLVATSKPGDTILFYYSGHGSLYPAARSDQISGYDSTIVSADARGPDVDTAVPDILDTEIKRRIDQATAYGINVVTIFDSCNSGTATRDITGRVRSAPPATSAPPVPSSPPPLPDPVGSFATGYRVHFAAAADGQDARERPLLQPDGSKPDHGVFTTAFVAVLPTMKAGSYRDIADAVAARLAANREAQTPNAEGDAMATPFLASARQSGRNYRATMVDATHVSLADGILGGVTSGSTYDIRPAGTAVTGAPLASGTVAVADTVSATIALAHPLPATITPTTRLMAIETTHDYGAAMLRVQLAGGTPVAQGQVTALLAPMTMVTLVDHAPQFIIQIDGAAAKFATADGRVIKAAGSVTDPAFAAQLGDAVRAAANYYALLALANTPRAQQGLIEIKPSPQDDGSLCVFTTRDDITQAHSGCNVDVRVTNATPTTPLYRYVLFLRPTDYAVTVLSPQGDSNDPPLAPQDDFLAFQGTLKNKGNGTVLLLLTQKPINVAALRQDGVRDIGADAPNPLERLLRAAATGQRAIEADRSGDYSAVIASFAVSQ